MPEPLAGHERIVITDGGQPIAALTSLQETHSHMPLPDREDKIKGRSPIDIDLADCMSEMRG